MFLVVDASELFSFFKKGSERRKLIRELPKRRYELVSPDFVFEELVKDKDRIMKYSKINELQFKLLLSVMERRIRIVPKSEYAGFVKEAKSLAPHDKDVPYFALALMLNCPLWSDELAFKRQSKITVHSTKDLLNMLQ